MTEDKTKNWPNVSLIAACTRNGRVIGDSKINDMPWHIPQDLKYFKSVTLNSPVIMGRKTFESIGHALTKRINIVITRDASYRAPGIDVCTSMEEALNHAARLGLAEIFVIGGGEIYRQAMPYASAVYLTYIDADFKGDVTFPELPESEWAQTTADAHDDVDSNLGPIHVEWCVFERLPQDVPRHQ